MGLGRADEATALPERGAGGLAGYLLSREQFDEELAAGWQPLLLKAVDELRAEPKAAGAGVFICDACVATFSEIFATKPPA